ncbi:MAG: hypothetical protein LKG27_02990 [Clostridiaceae bacterium]|jgi:hypothetical protein|nr:hypothetical protein [Clostridiaceae bacterium]
MAEVQNTQLNSSVNGASGQNLTVSTNVSATGTSSSNIPLVTKNKKALTAEDLKKLAALGYTQEKLTTMSDDAIQKALNQTVPVTPKASASSMSSALEVEGDTPSDNSKVKTTNAKAHSKAKVKNVGSEYNFKSFKNEKNYYTKAKMLLREFVKNKYNNSNNGKSWDDLSDQEKTNIENQTSASLLKKYNKSGKNISIAKIISALKNPKSKSISQRALKRYSDQMDTFMSDIQAANEKGMEYSTFKAQAKDIRNDQKYAMLDRIAKANHSEIKDSMSTSDYEFYQTENTLNEAGKLRFGLDENCSNSKIRDEIQQYNKSHPDNPISEISIKYDYLNDKIKKGESLTSAERRSYHYYDSLAKAKFNLGKQPNYDSSNTTFANMYEDSIYQKAIASGKSPKDAEIAYLNAKLKAGKGKGCSPEEFDKRFKALLEGCSEEGAQELIATASYMKEHGYIVFAGQNMAVNNKAAVAGIGKIDGKSLHSAVKKGNVSSEYEVCFDNYYQQHKQWDRVKDVHRNCPATAKDAYKRAKENNVTDDEWNAIADDYTTNRKEYTTDASAAILDAGGSYVSKSHQTAFINNIKSMIADTKNANDYKHFAGSAHTYEVENQTKVADSVMSLSKSFDKKSAIVAINALSDDIQNCDKSNQLAMHKTVMTSDYTEVRQHAAGNIGNYDSSVQADAYRATIATGDEKAIAVATAQHDRMTPEAQASTASEYKAASAQSETQYAPQVISDIIEADNNLKGSSKTTLEDTLASKMKEYQSGQCSINAVMDAFLKAPNNERMAMLKPLVDKNALRPDTLRLLVKYCPNLLLSMVDTFIANGQGQAILSVIGKSSEVTYKVVQLMMTRGSNADKAVAAKYVIDNPSQFSKETRQEALRLIDSSASNVIVSYKTDEDTKYMTSLHQNDNTEKVKKEKIAYKA